MHESTDAASDTYRNPLDGGVTRSELTRRAVAQRMQPEWNEVSDFIAHYMQSLQANPTDPSLHNVLGVALAKQGSLDMAIKHYETALIHDSSFFPAYYNLGR
jgi:cytochrome c-type biogenesis protein CcmH/NrfG